MHTFIQKSLFALVITLTTTASFGMEYSEDNFSSPFDYLPNEVKCMVLSKFNEQELAILSQVDHEFHNLSNDDQFWEKLFHEHAEITVALNFHDSPNESITRYATYRDAAKRYPAIATLYKWHKTIQKPENRSWKDHYKTVFGSPYSFDFMEKENTDTNNSTNIKKTKKKCLVS